MNVIKIFGGVGNQLFQYALYRKLRENGSCYLDLGWFDNKQREYWYPYQINDLNLEADIILREDYIVKEYYSENHRISEDIFSNHIIQNGRNNVPIINLVSGNNPYDYKDYENVDNSYIIGYFQNIEYLKGIIKDIKKEVKFPKTEDMRFFKIKNNILNQNSVSVHIRFNDYAGIEDFEEVCPMEYYVKAIEYMKKHVVNPQFYIFSNKIEEAKEKLPVLGEYTFVDIYDRSYGLGDMELISLCKHNIISNSTFSWWATVLNKNENKIVIAPNKWDIRPVALKCQGEINLWFDDWVRIEP